MKELCQLCGTRIRLSEVKHVSVAFTLLRCYTFTMLKKPFTFSLSEKQLNFLLVSTSSFRCVCSLFVWMKFSRDAAGRSFPAQRGRNYDSPESRLNITTTERMYPFIFMRLARGGCIVY